MENSFGRAAIRAGIGFAYPVDARGRIVSPDMHNPAGIEEDLYAALHDFDPHGTDRE
ncbi:nickel-dependent hydrogenase large subunit [Methylocaldum marinum]|uniref:Nickel-dependent hydrogenase large subunit n=1 Tax=Methylocaldum marinum TaxID=1432792 RepID=A0A250KVY6_9GAMM|nr:hypothetical protein [Methylocaldum marinum]BBA35833.1 nickel-dependent hydrogenase large subunit [Methylocaldum marinum]